MSAFHNNSLIGSSGQGGGYNLTNSLRFRSSASAYLNRTPASAGNRQTWTWSGWVKRGTLGTYQQIFGAYIGSGNTDTNYFEISFSSSDLILITGYSTVYRRSTAVYRDPSAWYHIIVAVDTTQATAGNRLKVYVNGSEVTAFGTSNNPTQNTNLGINGAYPHGIGAIPANVSYFDGYQTEVNFIDGQALTPSSFGETSSTTGVWIPKKYTGTYGTNGFYLKFTDTTSTSTLGTDFSGNSNTWTVNNISLTAGSTYDSMNDVPTLTNATTANYCVLSPVDIPTTGSPATLSDGNLKCVTPSSGYGFTTGTIAISSGKWYWEYVATAGSPNLSLGFGLTTCARTYAGDTGSYIYYAGDGKTYANAGAGVTYGSTWTTGDVIAVALDLDAGTAVFYKNNVSQGTAFTGLTGTFLPIFSDQSPSVSNTFTVNFGQRPFSYTPPTGFNRLNTFNLPTPTIGATASTQANRYFDTVIWTGDQTNKQIPLNFTADFVWAKRRNSGDSNVFYDVIRGVNNGLNSDNTNAEFTSNYGLDFDNGNYLAIDGTQYFGGGGGSGITFVAWNWEANGTGVTNTAGSITSTVSANTSSGFSIVTFTGNGTSSQTVGHGLGVTPTFFILKSRGTQVWNVYSLAGGITGNTILQLNDSSGAVTGSNISLTASSTTIGFGSASQVNGSGVNFVAYCFAPVAGYSAMGSYTGNGSSDGTFVYTGFRPRFVMWKNSTQGSQWILLDTARNTYNVSNAYLEPNTSDAENTANTVFDMLSNGFKLRNSGGTDFNESANTYIYMAFAESPFKYANAR
jgi:hypothetical protein